MFGARAIEMTGDADWRNFCTRLRVVEVSNLIVVFIFHIGVTESTSEGIQIVISVDFPEARSAFLSHSSDAVTA